jgi:hypothetical protein
MSVYQRAQAESRKLVDFDTATLSHAITATSSLVSSPPSTSVPILHGLGREVAAVHMPLVIRSASRVPTIRSREPRVAKIPTTGSGNLPRYSG